MTVATIESSNNAMLEGSGANYGTVQALANASYTTNNTTPNVGQDRWDTPLAFVYRACLIFDTSAIPADATISTATLSLAGGGAVTLTWDLTIVSGADLADTIVSADYGELLNDTTSLGSIAMSEWSEVAYNVITLNAAGIAAITKAGTTRFGLRSSKDISATEPALDAGEFITLNVTTLPPKLTITYGALTGEGKGVFSVVETAIHYVDGSGVERFFIGQPAI